MGEGNEGRRKGIESLSLQTQNYPGHLLQRFIFSASQKSEFWDADEDEESEDVELSLGLSLGGRFGVNKNSKKLSRSSSIASTITIIRGDEALNPPVVAFPALMRTSSLPTETDEEWRKRKELQSLRRMEAKRRRSEKQRCKEIAGGCFEENMPEIEGLATVNFWENKELSLAHENLEGLTAHQHNRVAAAAKRALFGRIVDAVKKGKGGFPVGYGGGEGWARPVSQGSAESQAGSSSGMSEMESRPLQGSSSCEEARISSSNSMLQEQGDGDGDEDAGGGSSKTKTKENTGKTRKEMTKNSPYKRDGVSSGVGGNSAEDMPSVFTVGDGVNGRRVEGILYKYGNGEEVRIMCVCHGAFLSPAQFVKHAGGGDVAHPLRHIVVNPTSSSFS